MTNTATGRHRAASPASLTFSATRFGTIMTPKVDEPHEAWGVLNPGGIRAPDGTMHLFPRLVAEGNYSRIGHARVVFDDDKPVGVERLGIAIEPHEPYEVASGGGGVEDSRVVYIPRLKLYVMTYTAFVPNIARIAIAVSEDLETWRRLGPLQFERMGHLPPVDLVGNKDATFFPSVVRDPKGVESFAILHRPTARFMIHLGQTEITLPLAPLAKLENVWISYVAVENVLDDIANLTVVRRHERVMGPQQTWETAKLGAGAPPVHTPGGWLLPYHAVSMSSGHPRYCMGIAILDLDRPTRVLYRTPAPILEPETDYERNGAVSNVVFPSATDLRPNGDLDVYYGAADRVIAVARITLPSQLKVAS